jgi:hypothetical protein
MHVRSLDEAATSPSCRLCGGKGGYLVDAHLYMRYVALFAKHSDRTEVRLGKAVSIVAEFSACGRNQLIRSVDSLD